MNWSPHLKVVVAGKPVPKARPRFSRTGHAYTPAKTRAAEKAIALAAGQAMVYDGVEITDQPVRLSVVAVMPVPKSWSRAKKAEALAGWVTPTGRPDIDNVAKLVSDALNGVAYHDDSQIIEAIAQKAYGVEPRTIIAISTPAQEKK
jgi:Holliday junction resolvase RusA-like endonuclease